MIIVDNVCCFDSSRIMARPLRIEYEGALYHVLSRGNNQQNIFLADSDRQGFLKVLGEMAERFDADIFAYVLMENHYHLLLRTNQANLSKSMQWLGTTYTTRFNLTHSRSGHLFQGRYKSILVEDDAYLMQLSCYIHRNPLRAGIVRRLMDYRWSSYPAYAYERRHPDWLNTAFILSQFKTKDRHRVYREKVQKYSDEKHCVWEEIKHGVFYGTQAFIERIKDTYITDDASLDVPAPKRTFRDVKPEAIIDTAAALLGCDVLKLKQARRISKADKTNRDLLIYLLLQTGNLSNSEIGKHFDLTYSAISRRVMLFGEELGQDRKLRGKYEKIKSQIKV